MRYPELKRRRKRFAPERAGGEGRSEDVKAGGAVLVKAEQEEIRRTFTSNRVTGDLANSIKCTAVKKRGSGQCVEVYPHGKTAAGAERNRWLCPPIRANQHARAPVVHAFAPEGNAGSSSGYAAGMGGRTGMIDTVDRLLKSTLDALCPNVARLFFRGKAGTYITYQLVSSEDMAPQTTKRTARNTHTGLIFTRNAIISPFAPCEAGVEGGGLLRACN